MKADRLRTLVESITRDYPNGCVYACKEEFLRLLRREQAYQRATVRRIIKAERSRLSQVVPQSRSCSLWIKAKQDVLADILAALNRRTT